jgi:hypothetical protein
VCLDVYLHQVLLVLHSEVKTGGIEYMYALHPSQRTLESSTSLVFALFAVEASMISRPVGKTGASSCYLDIVMFPLL